MSLLFLDLVGMDQLIYYSALFTPILACSRHSGKVLSTKVAFVVTLFM